MSGKTHRRSTSSVARGLARNESVSKERVLRFRETSPHTGAAQDSAIVTLIIRVENDRRRAKKQRKRRQERASRRRNRR